MFCINIRLAPGECEQIKQEAVNMSDRKSWLWFGFADSATVLAHVTTSRLILQSNVERRIFVHVVQCVFCVCVFRLTGSCDVGTLCQLSLWLLDDNFC